MSTDWHSVHVGRIARLPTRDEVPLRVYERALERVERAEAELAKANEALAAAALLCRQEKRLTISREAFDAPGDPPMMPEEP